MSIPNLQAPNRDTENPEKHNKGSGTFILVLSGIIVCLILIIIVLIFTPSSNDIKFSGDKIGVISKKQQQEKIMLEVQSGNIIGEKKPFNENSQIEWLMRKTDAEQNNMLLWAEKDFNKALELANQAEQLKQRENNQEAENYYRQATQIITKTLEEKEKHRDELLQKAEQALEDDNLVLAKQSYESVQLIDPDDEKLKDGLNRLENRYKVKQLYDQALENKKNNRLDEAIIELEKALALEPENKKIKEALYVLLEEQIEPDFNRTISTVLNAIENNDLTKARLELNNAKKLKKNDPVINELENRIKEKNKNLVINILQKQASQQEGDEQWQEALNSYKKILSHDPDTNIAKTSQQRVRSYLNLNALLDSIILKPQRLQNDNIFKRSKESLVIIKTELKQKRNLLHPIEKTPKLAEKMTLAETIVKQAAVKIPLTITSDNKTDIVIYKIGKLGKFKEHKIILRPGQYTIVGSRTGYRDYRKKLNINATDRSLSINVQCQEKI